MNFSPLFRGKIFNAIVVTRYETRLVSYSFAWTSIIVSSHVVKAYVRYCTIVIQLCPPPLVGLAWSDYFQEWSAKIQRSLTLFVRLPWSQLHHEPRR